MLSTFGGINVGFKQSNIPYIEISHSSQKRSKKGKAWWVFLLDFSQKQLKRRTLFKNVTYKYDEVMFSKSIKACIVMICSFILASPPESDRKDLLSELDVLKTLKPHPHVIQLLGCVTETGKKNWYSTEMIHIFGR